MHQYVEPESLINLLAAKRATTMANKMLNKLSPRSTISSIRDSSANVQQMSKVMLTFFRMLYDVKSYIFSPLFSQYIANAAKQTPGN